MGELVWPTLLLACGLALVVAEGLIPSGGTLGLLAAVCLGASLYVAHDHPSGLGGRWLALEAVAVPATLAGTIYALPRTKLGRRVYLQPPSTADLGHPGPDSPTHAIGTVGRALTPLRPSGMIDLGGRRVEAMAESGLIEVGAAVVVVAVRSGRAVVRLSTPGSDAFASRRGGPSRSN